MGTAIVSAPSELLLLPKQSYLNSRHGLKSWLLTLDHKRIALLYLFTTTFFFVIGGTAAALIRLELLTPAGDLVSSDTYNKLFSIHGIIMVFFFLVPIAPAVLGNFLIPLMIGAKDVAFPKINLFSWYLFVIGGSVELYMMIVGGVDTGWTFTTPLSTHYLNTNVIAAAMGIFIAGFSSILTGLNFIVTIHRMRAPGMTWFRLPLFIWSYYATSIIFVLATPVIAISMVLIVLERVFGIGVFDPTNGGDPLLFQHLFWFYSHPAVYVMILPGMGIISEVIACFCRKRVFGYTAVAFSSVAIAVFSFFVWAHHMFIMGISNYSALVFSFMTMLVAVPSAIKVFNWSATMYKGSISFDTPMLYALGLHRSLHDGWIDRSLSGFARHGYPPDRNIFHRGALPLRDGRRHGERIHGWPALLVAQDDRKDVSGVVGKAGRRDSLYWFQSDVLPAVHSWLSWHAPALSCVSRRSSRY